VEFVANELCRAKKEIFQLSNRRSNISFHRLSFPNIDFSDIETDEDTLWFQRDSPNVLFAHAKLFLRWLLDRPESQIAIVSQSTFIFYICQVLSTNCSDSMQKIQMMKKFQDCEMRTLVIWDRLAPNCYGIPFSRRLLTSTHFKGGLHCNNSTMIESNQGLQATSKIKKSKTRFAISKTTNSKYGLTWFHCVHRAGT
jgi:hypothetical protein